MLGVADVALQLERLLVSPALLLGLGDSMNVGFNLQQRATGVCLTACEYDYQRLLQQCGRVQRIPRALTANDAGALAVNMPVASHTIEQMILAPMLQRGAKEHSGHGAGSQ